MTDSEYHEIMREQEKKRFQIIEDREFAWKMERYQAGVRKQGIWSRVRSFWGILCN